MASRARVQANRLLSGLVPIAMDHHSSGCLLAEKFPISVRRGAILYGRICENAQTMRYLPKRLASVPW